MSGRAEQAMRVGEALRAWGLASAKQSEPAEQRQTIRNICRLLRRLSHLKYDRTPGSQSLGWGYALIGCSAALSH